MSPRATESERGLQPAQRRKLAWWIERLKTDGFAGDQIQKRLIPAGLTASHGLPAPLGNLWRFELPLAHRALYTLQQTPTENSVVFILEILNHKEYDRLFGYRTS